MMKFKKGVKINGILPELAFVQPLIKEIAEKYSTDYTITSGVDGKHMTGSLHPLGGAIDIRTRDLYYPWQKQQMAAALRSCLTDEFDIVEEEDHIHIEFDPK